MRKIDEYKGSRHRGGRIGDETKEEREKDGALKKNENGHRYLQL